MKSKLIKIRQVFLLLFGCAKTEAVLLILLSVFRGIYTSLGLILWKYFLDIITEAILTKEFRNVIIMTVCYFFYTAMFTVITRASEHIKWKYVSKLNIRLSERIINKSYDIAYEEFDKSDTYDTLRKVNNESISSISGLLQQIMALVEAVVSLVSVIVILLPFSVAFVIIAIISTIPMIIVDVKMAKKLYELNNELTEPRRYADKFKGMLTDYLCIREIKVYKAFHYIKDKVVTLQEESFQRENKAKVFQLKVDIILNIVFLFVSFVLKLITICVSITRTYTIGTISMYINALDMLASTLQAIVYNIAELNESRLYINLLLGFLEKENATPGEHLLTGSFNKLEFEDVSFQYYGQGQYTLEHVSFSIKKNSSYLIYGINGAGKSTILKLLLGLYKPTEGRILVDGIDLRDIEQNSYYSQLGVVFQEFNKYPLKVRENIALNDVADEKELVRVAEEINADTFIRELDSGYEAMLSNELKDGVQLSLGQWQKLAIARMLYQKAEVYILDEPSASLDQTTTERLNHLLFDKSNRHTLVMVSHNEEIARQVDEIIVLGDKHVLEVGNYNELMAKRGYFYSNIAGEDSKKDEDIYEQYS